MIAGCVACPELAATRTRTVSGALPLGARLLLLGEAPGAAEDASGQPFVGRAGQVLDAALEAAGLTRAEVAIINTLKCRPPGNRRPRPAELDACRPWTLQQLTLVRPELLVTLGGTAAAWALGRRTVTLTALRGTLHRGPEGLPVLATYHPSAALRFGPNGQPLAALRADLLEAARLLREGVA